jgi:hypothetical protein
MIAVCVGDLASTQKHSQVASPFPDTYPLRMTKLLLDERISLSNQL